MSEPETWAERLAAGAKGSGSVEQQRAGRPAPAWSRLAAARLMGEAPAKEDVADVQRRPPRSESERRLLERLGHTEDDTPPAA